MSCSRKISIAGTFLAISYAWQSTKFITELILAWDYQNLSNREQGHVIVKPNLFILSLLVGMGVFFLIMPLAQTWLVRHEYKDLICQVMQHPYDIPLISRSPRRRLYEPEARAGLT